MGEKIRTPIIWFSFFAALMLFQTSYMRLGTITAFVTLAATILTAIASGNVSLRRFSLSRDSGSLLIFLLMVSMVTVVSGSLPSGFSRFAAQIILCIVLIAMEPINRREEEFIKTVFIIATLAYAVLTIRSCYQLGTTRYYHGNIELFNARLDPNFIGIPFVAASVLVLNNILTGKKRLLNAACYIVLAIAIVYTASRGNMICLALSNALVVLFYMQKKNVHVLAKILWIVLIIIAIGLLSGYLETNFTAQWERMTSFGEGADNGRFELWTRAAEAWRESPLFGKGLGGMYRIYGKATHNTYLQLLSETGVLGTILFLTFIVRLLKEIFKADKVYFCLLAGTLVQIGFLDALDNRGLWVVLCWFSLIAKSREAEKNVEKNTLFSGAET